MATAVTDPATISIAAKPLRTVSPTASGYRRRYATAAVITNASGAITALGPGMEFPNQTWSWPVTTSPAATSLSRLSPLGTRLTAER